jgi:hypothetical protein
MPLYFRARRQEPMRHWASVPTNSSRSSHANCPTSIPQARLAASSALATDNQEHDPLYSKTFNCMFLPDWPKTEINKRDQSITSNCNPPAVTWRGEYFEQLLPIRVQHTLPCESFMGPFKLWSGPGCCQTFVRNKIVVSMKHRRS